MMRTKYSPVALFAYRRVALLDKVLDALEACPEFDETDIYIFCDGPKNEAAEVDVAKVRARLRARARSNFTIVEAPSNQGLSASIISGVSRLCANYGRAIVIEDDLIVSPVLLSWFNAALDRYANDDRVMQVSGHMFSSLALADLDEALFLPMITSWGWATWDRAWKTFEPDAPGWEVLVNDRVMRRRFDLDGVYPYSRMLQRQMAGEIDSWAIRWNWTLFRMGGLAIYPPQSMIANEGIDGDATHRGLGGKLRGIVARRKVPLRMAVPALPDRIEIDSRTYALAKRSIWRSTSKLSPYYWLTR